MGLVSGLMKAGIARKVMKEAQKPQNQRRVKEMISKATNRGGKRR